MSGEFTDGQETVAAVLHFDAEHDLVDFVSYDRTRASSDGTSFTAQQWSTPVSGYREVDGRRVVTVAEGVWRAPEPEGTFTYVDLLVDDITYNVP